jgi:5-(carboxyamino)imidazole ribonucleotide synthase
MRHRSKSRATGDLFIHPESDFVYRLVIIDTIMQFGDAHRFIMTRLGILGGGQLAQMLTQAAIALGIETVIFERQPDSPASRLTAHQLVGAWDDAAALVQFAALCDVVTLENEFVDATVLRRLGGNGLSVYPTAETLALVQDKLTQKTHMRNMGVPVPDFWPVDTIEDVRVSAYPALLKARRDGYDGYGNVTLRSADDVSPAWEKLGARQLMVEAFVPFVSELAVMVVRGRDGEIRTYPVVETVQQNHICHVVRAPAQITEATAKRAEAIARQAVEAINGVGVFGVELFELSDGTVLYNEIAPRPHNSGHYTIEGCVTSQFENHLRAVLGWPLGSTAMIAPAAVMVNLLGQRNEQANVEGIREALGVAGARMHVYGKREVRIGRKMGHVTALGATIHEAEAIAQQAADKVRL